MSFPRYPAYKPSGVEWLGQIPEHWGVLQSRRMFKARREAAKEGAIMLTASQKYGMISQAEFVEREGRRVVEVIQGKDNLIQVEPDDFVISMRSFQGGLEWCRLSGSTSFHYVPVTPIKQVVPSFFAHLMKSDRYISALRATTNLIRDGQEIRYSNFVQVPLPIIPECEQIAISSFLDRETAKIDALIAEQQRLVEIFKVKLSSLALSGFQDEKPNYQRIGRVTRVASRPVDIKADDEYEPLGLLNRGRGIFHKETRKGSEMGDSDFFYVEAGDLVLSGQFAWEGSVAMTGKSESGCVVSHRYPIIQGDKENCLTEFLLALLWTEHGDFLLNQCSRGAAGRNRPLNLGLLLKEQIALPCLSIQRKIQEEYRKYVELKNEQSRQTELALERRSAFISAAVTGQIDVRGLAEREGGEQ